MASQTQSDAGGAQFKWWLRPFGAWLRPVGLCLGPGAHAPQGSASRFALGYRVTPLQGLEHGSQPASGRPGASEALFRHDGSQGANPWQS